MRKSGKRHHRTACLNAVELAINRAKALSVEDVAQQHAIVDGNISMLAGHDPAGATHWRSLADILGMSESLAEIGIGSGPAAVKVLEEAQDALQEVHDRWRACGAWSLDDEERDRLLWLAELHTVQLKACSYGEFERAMERTRNRMRQALAGNAGPGTVVIAGEFGVAA